MRPKGLNPFVQDFARRIDFLLTRKEEEDVAGGLHQVNLEDSDQGRFEIVWLRFFGVQRLDGECTTRDGENGAAPEVGGEFGGVECCGCTDKLEFRPPLACLWQRQPGWA